MTRPDQTRLDQHYARNSSLELLRIVGMLFIIACHFSGHGRFGFSPYSITLNRLWLQLIVMGGSLGNDIFVLLSGYFLVKSPGINFHKLFDLWLRMFVYSVIIFAAFSYFGIINFSWRAMIRIMMPITRNQWWFASAYFVMYLVHPYVNILLGSLSREDYKKFLVAIFIYWSIIPTFTNSEFGASYLTNFICLYSLAGYFRLWARDFGSKKFVWYGILFIALNFITACIFDVISWKFHILDNKQTYFYGMLRPFTVMAVACLLVGFRKLDIHSKFVNILASATFGVYLIHDNNFVRPFLWQSVFHNASFQDSEYLIPYSLAVITIVYISCTVIELARIKIFMTLSRGKLS